LCTGHPFIGDSHAENTPSLRIIDLGNADS